jgi:hypothetical protein
LQTKQWKAIYILVNTCLFDQLANSEQFAFLFADKDQTLFDALRGRVTDARKK